MGRDPERADGARAIHTTLPQLAEDVVASGQNHVLATARNPPVIVDGFLHGAYYTIFPRFLLPMARSVWAHPFQT